MNQLCDASLSVARTMAAALHPQTGGSTVDLNDPCVTSWLSSFHGLFEKDKLPQVTYMKAFLKNKILKCGQNMHLQAGRF